MVAVATKEDIEEKRLLLLLFVGTHLPIRPPAASSPSPPRDENFPNNNVQYGDEEGEGIFSLPREAAAAASVATTTTTTTAAAAARCDDVALGTPRDDDGDGDRRRLRRLPRPRDDDDDDDDERYVDVVPSQRGRSADASAAVVVVVVVVVRRRRRGGRSGG